MRGSSKSWKWVEARGYLEEKRALKRWGVASHKMAGMVSAAKTEVLIIKSFFGVVRWFLMKKGRMGIAAEPAMVSIVVKPMRATAKLPIVSAG